MFCELATKQRCLGSTAARIHIVVPPSSERYLNEVRLDNHHDLINRQITVKRLPENRGVQCYLIGRRPPQRFFDTWEKRRDTLLKANSAFLRKVVQRGLDDTLFCRAHISMKVNFGTMVVFGYEKTERNSQSHDTLYFLEMMRDKNIHAEVLRQ